MILEKRFLCVCLVGVTIHLRQTAKWKGRRVISYQAYTSNMSKSPHYFLSLKLQEKISRLLSKQKHVVIALDGRSGVGKSTIADKLAEESGAVVIDCDDFYTGPPEGSEKNWHRKTPQEKVEQVFAWQRMREVLQQLIANQTAQYHPFDFASGQGLSKEWVYVEPTSIIILDGVYTAGMLKDLVDIAVLVEFPDEGRRKRLIKREGESFMRDWHAIWDSAEDYYFTQVKPRESFDFVLEG